MLKLKYVTACNQNDRLVHIDNASKDEQYHCPECGGEMILYVSERGLRRTYFAHKSLTANCTPESVLHRSYKEFLFQRIKYHLATDTALPFSWKCDYCREQHTGNLIKKCNNVKVEFVMEQARPDIALLDSQGNVFAVIEIVVTHKPEENVLAFYRVNNIILIMIELTKEDDLKLVFDEALSFSCMDFCTNPKCSKCSNYMLRKQLFIITGPCSLCQRSMKLAATHVVGTGYYDGPDEFSKEELNMAQGHGAIIKKQYSRTLKEKYNANTCPHCNAFAGQFFLFKDYVSPGLYGQYPLTIINAGWACTNCDYD